MSTSMSTASDNTSHDRNHNKDVTKPLVIIIAGPTAVGKSAVAAKICSNEWSTEIIQQHALNNANEQQNSQTNPNVQIQARGHIISADSVQVYEGVQIGANKPTITERAETPHHLIDIVDSRSVCKYNAASWMRDTMQVLDRLKHNRKDEHDGAASDADTDDEVLAQDEEASVRKARIEAFLSQNVDEPKEHVDEILPVVVGGTMMYLQWLVHGRPDAMKPSPEALERAATTVAKYESMQKGQDDNDSDNESNNAQGWNAAVEHASSLGPLFADRVSKLPGKDWYRLRRTLEVAYTVLHEDNDTEKIKKLYNGQRQGGLDSSPDYDVRCFFLCPDDRMAHTAVVDSRCEQMLAKGLLKETTDLYLSGQLPDEGQQARAIGYRQTLDYLKRDIKDEDLIPNHNSKEFQSYLDEFTTSTRRYAKKQMQWFRKDSRFMFVPVEVAENSTSRVDTVAEIIKEMCIKSRKEFDMELIPFDDPTSAKQRKNVKKAGASESDKLNHLPLSARTKILNERQGKNMKFYQSKRHLLLEGSEEYALVMKEADECTARMQRTLKLSDAEAI
jgi:tRNA dimethylallyltransferase